MSEPKTRILNDSIIKEILSELTIINKIRLERVCKQFADCVQQVLSNEKTIKFVDNYNNSCDVYVNKDKKTVINLRDIGFELNENLTQLLRKCGQLKRLEFDNNIHISHQMIQWICNQCPHLDSLSVLDYRCNYLTIDWLKIGDCFKNSLVSLEIESRLHQQIYNKDLAELVSKLESLQELSIVYPRRRLDEVFASLGPNLMKLKVIYSLGLCLDEMNAIINGNGKRLQELVMHYEPDCEMKNQNFVFRIICNNLSDLKAFTFNHKSLSDSSLLFITNLKSLKQFNYNLNAIEFSNGLSFNVFKRFDFRVFFDCFIPLISLTLNSIELFPKTIATFQQLLPNIQRLTLEAKFSCECDYNRFQSCQFCNKKCITFLANLKTLRYIHFSYAFNDLIVEYLDFLDQINYLELNISNCHYCLIKLMAVLINLANKHPNRLVTTKLYGLDISRILKLIESQMPQNLRLINIIKD